MQKVCRAGFVGLAILCASEAHAEVRLPAILSDHVVLQRDKVLPIWGWADPAEQVSVSLGKETLTATAAADGRWIVRLPAQLGRIGVPSGTLDGSPGAALDRRSSGSCARACVFWLSVDPVGRRT